MKTGYASLIPSGYLRRRGHWVGPFKTKSMLPRGVLTGVQLVAVSSMADLDRIVWEFCRRRHGSQSTVAQSDSLWSARVRLDDSSLLNRGDRNYGRIRDKMMSEVVRERAGTRTRAFPAIRHASVRFSANVDTDKPARTNCRALLPVEARDL